MLILQVRGPCRSTVLKQQLQREKHRELMLYLSQEDPPEPYAPLRLFSELQGVR